MSFVVSLLSCALLVSFVASCCALLASVVAFLLFVVSLLEVAFLLCVVDEFHSLLVMHHFLVTSFVSFLVYCALMVSSYHLLVVAPNEFHPVLIVCHLFVMRFQFVFVIIYLLIN
jgi:hypothetical protein